MYIVTLFNPNSQLILFYMYGINNLALSELLSCTEWKSLREYCNIQLAQDEKNNVTFIFFLIFHDECISLIYFHGNSTQDSNGFHTKSSAGHTKVYNVPLHL